MLLVFKVLVGKVTFQVSMKIKSYNSFITIFKVNIMLVPTTVCKYFQVYVTVTLAIKIKCLFSYKTILFLFPLKLSKM